MYDLVLKDATIIDGTGSPRYDANIAIQNGYIKKIQTKPITRATRIIDVGGRYVTPGFIDAVNHSDTHVTLLTQPSQDSLIRQGVTTIIGGSCGASLAPLIGVRAIQSIQKWGNINALNVNWQTMTEYFSYLNTLSFGLNYASLLGYGTLRRGLLEDQYRPLSRQEVGIIIQQIRNSLQQGAIGMSQGLAYGHLHMATPDELVEVARVVGKMHKTQVLHLRDDGQNIIQAVEEAITLASEGKVTTHIAHLKILGKKNWKFFDEMISLIDSAIAKHIPLSFSIFPYTANNSVMYLLLPYWVAEGGKKVMLEKLQDPKLKARAIKDMKANNVDYSKIYIAFSPIDKASVGKSLIEIAKNQSMGVEEALIQIVLASQAQASVIMHAINPAHMKTLAKHPSSIITSDGVGYDENHIRSSQYVHPRSYGAFPQFLQMVCEREIQITLEQAIHKITGKVAQIYHLQKRGIVKEGYFADLVVLNTASLKSQATFANPLVYPRGIEWVVVNGKISIEQEEYINTGNGQVITY
jgi:N-acyl-D-amino-acid deacylase